MSLRVFRRTINRTGASRFPLFAAISPLQMRFQTAAPTTTGFGDDSGWGSFDTTSQFQDPVDDDAAAPTSAPAREGGPEMPSVVDTLVAGEQPVIENALAPAIPMAPKGPQTAIPLPGLHAPAPAIAAPQGTSIIQPSTGITNMCDTLSQCLSKAEELRHQLRANELGDTSAQIITKDGMDEYIDELKATAVHEMNSLIIKVVDDQAVLQKAGMHELRRTLFYATSLQSKEWIDEPQYQTLMKGLSIEFLRRDYDGALTADDVLFISTHVVMSNYYNRHLWNRMEDNLFRWRTFENVDMGTIKGMSTKLYRTLRGAKAEGMDVRRKILNAMSKRVGILANDFELPALLGILQCYAKHDLMPKFVEPLCHRAINHISDFTPQECAALCNVLRKFGLMRLEVCEKLVERMCLSDQLTFAMAHGALNAIRQCYNRVSEGGRQAINAEPMKQKLRALGEQVACRLDEVEYPNLHSILLCLDIVVTSRIYVPKKCLQNLFVQACDIITQVMEGKELVNKNTGQPQRPVTNEEARQLQGMLNHYGVDLCADLSQKLKTSFKDGIFPDEASVL